MPGLGNLADGANAAWYTAEGRYNDAAWSVGAAVVGAGIGVTIAKWFGRGAKSADDVAGLAKGPDDDPEGQLALADRMVKVAEQGDLAMVSPARVSMVYDRQGELLIDLGQSQRGAEALRQAANLQSDEDAKVLLNEMAVEALAKP